MPTRPSQAGSSGTWGTELNAWLDVAHNSDGTIGAGQTGATAATRFVGATTSGAPISGTFVAGDFLLDKTGHVWVCITGGTPGTWTCATKSRDRLMNDARAILADNMPLGTVTAQGTLTSQKVFGQLFGLRAGDVVTGVALGCNNGAAGTSPTTARFGLADSTGKIVVLSGNVNAAASWVNGLPTFAFTAPYTVPTDGGYFGCFVVNGTWGTTQPSIGFNNNISTYGVAIGSGVRPSFQWLTQTDLPAVNSSLTMTAVATPIYYMALY